MKWLAATAVLLGAVATGCSDDGSDAATPTTTTRRPPSCDHFRAGDRIPGDEALSGRLDLQGEPCVRTFDCADGRVHVAVKQGGEWTLEGFSPTDQSGNPRADTSDAVWQEHGGEYQGFGRTKLQFDCGG
jgi:hypothetical protein